MAGGKEQGLQTQVALGSNPAQHSLPVQPWVTHFTSLNLHFLFVYNLDSYVLPTFRVCPWSVFLFVVSGFRFLPFRTFTSSAVAIPFSLFHPRVGIELSPPLLIFLKKITHMV